MTESRRDDSAQRVGTLRKQKDVVRRKVDRRIPRKAFKC